MTHATQVLEPQFSSTAAGFFNIITRLFSTTILLHTAAHTPEKISRMLGLSVTGYVIDTKFIIELFCFVFIFFKNQFSKIVKNKKIQNIKKKKKSKILSF